MRVNVVNGFSKHPEGGNPAGVVYLNEEPCSKEQNRRQNCGEEKPEHLTDEQMQQVAAWLHSLNCIYHSSEYRSFAIRYFTPAAEVPLCGHATIASFSYLYQKGVIGDGVYELVTTEAQLTVEVSEGIIWMEMDAPQLQQKLEPKMVQRICDAYELDVTALDETMEVRIVKSGLRDIHVCVKSRDDLLAGCAA